MEDNVIYKIYGLYALDDKSKTIRYVGYTKKSIKKRLSGHKSESKRYDRHKDRWVRKHNFNIDIILIEGDITSYELALEREIYWIDYYKKLGNVLVNATIGGDGTRGYAQTEERKEHLRQLNKGKKLSEDHKKKISESHMGKKISPKEAERLKFYRENISEESKQKIPLRRFFSKRNIITKDLTFIEMVNLRLDILEYEKISSKNNLYLFDDMNYFKSLETKAERERKEKIEKNKIKRAAEKIERDRIKEIDRLARIHKSQVKKDELNKRRFEEKRKRQELIDSGMIYKETNPNGDIVWRRVMPEETRQKLRDINLGKKQSEETIKKRSESSLKNRNGKKGVKLTEDDVREIRRLCNNNEKTSKELAIIYNMEYSTIRKIVLRQLWSDIE